MDFAGEFWILLTPILAIVGIVAGIAAYRLRRRRMALALTLVGILAIGYAVAWTFMSE